MTEVTDRIEESRPRHFRTYPKYRASGVKWLGAIPAHWQVQPLKHLASFSTGWTPPTGREDLYGGEHLWAIIADLGPRVLEATEKTISDMAIRLPQCRSFYVQCARYLGFDRGADIGSVGDCNGRLEDQVNRSMGWFHSLGRAERCRSWHREDVPLVPEKAIREAIVNAIVHRDYAITGSKVMVEVFDDRIDVTSPGSLPHHMTVENVRKGGRPRSRNEGLAHAVLVARLMEQRGRGWPMMPRPMREFNGTEPELIHDRVNRFARVRFDLRPDVR